MIYLVMTDEIDKDVNLIFNKKQCDVSLGLFLAFDYKNKIWLAVDHTTGDYFIEEFKVLDDAINYLRGEKHGN